MIRPPFFVGTGMTVAVDAAWFADLTRQHRRELHLYCYRMLGSFDAAEDHVQEVFLRAWRSADAFEERSSARTWLYRIATNACLDTLGAPNRRCSRTRTS